MKALTFIILLLELYAAAASRDCQSVVFRAVKGRDAVLPCGQAKVFLDGPDAHVVWFKDDVDFISRFPGDNIVKLCKGTTCPDDTSLRLSRVGEQQGGIYRCRVHYQLAPAVDIYIDLKIVDAPKTPVIQDEDGKPFSNHVFYLAAGQNLTMSCVVDDAQTGTLVWWERNGVEIEREETIQDGVLRSMMRITNATRAEADSNYQCLVQNADVTLPLSAGLTMTMILPPVSVEIRLNHNVNFEVGEPRVVDCVVVGCVPPPKITWHLGNVMLRSNLHKELHEGNFTVSSLTLAPSLRDDHHELICRVHNSHLPTEVFEDKVVLRVGYFPTCVNDPDEAKSYVDVQSEGVTCIVEAFPRPENFSWTFAGTKTRYTKVEKVPGYENRYSSSLKWKAQEMGEDELICRSSNAKGEQKRPCIFIIVARGPPLPPNCELVEGNKDNIRISCKKGWAQSQIIHLELENDKGEVVTRMRDNNGDFVIARTVVNKMTAVVYTSNRHGRSDRKPLNLTQTVATESADIDHKRPKRDIHAWTPFIVTVIACLIVIGFVAYGFKISRTARPSVSEDGDRNTTIRTDGLFHRQPEFRPVPSDDTRHNCSPRVTLNMNTNGNQYTLTPLTMPKHVGHVGHRCPDIGELDFTHHKPARILGLTPPPNDPIPVLDEDERTTYFV